jgi:spore coat polysaccharide biosynthesis predicted glycosyltransferase SpsG
VNNSKLLFRVDGGPQIGMGHVMRCLRLAKEIADSRQCEITFVTTTPEHLKPLLENYIPDATLKNFANDDFTSTLDFYKQFKPHVIISDVNLHSRIDDYLRFAENVPYHVNIHEMHFHHFYFGLVVFASILPIKPKCKCESRAQYFTGSKYLLVDSRLSSLGKPDFKSTGKLNLLITPGGADPKRISEKVLSILKQVNPDKSLVDINLVMGPANPRRTEIEKLAAEIESVRIVDSQLDLFNLIKSCDIVITNGGTTVYETIAASRPTWVIPQNEFEQEVGQLLMSKKTILGLGMESLKAELLDKLPEIRINADNVIATGKKLIDGKGTIRLAKKIINALDSIISK